MCTLALDVYTPFDVYVPHAISANYEPTNTHPNVGGSQNELTNISCPDLNSAGPYTASDKASCKSVKAWLRETRVKRQ